MKTLEIKNYKGFEHLKLDNLARINLFVGKNNVGKSALLEAISIVVSNGDLEWIKSILENRGEGVRFSSTVENQPEKEMERFTSLYTNRNLTGFFNKPIEILSDDTTSDLFQENIRVELKLVEYINKKEIGTDGIQKISRQILAPGTSFDFMDSEVQNGLLISNIGRIMLYTFDGNKGSRSRISTSVEKPFEYIRTNQIKGEKNSLLYSRIALTPMEKEIVEGLRIIEPKIEQINFLKDDRVFDGSLNRDDLVPFAILSNSSQRYRLSSMGDGLNRVLTIILSMLNCKGGVLLIDEFENGLHYSVQYQLWEIIYRLAEQLDIQVFVTSHSVDTLRGLSKLIECHSEEDMKEKVSFYYLQEMKDGSIKGYRSDADSFRSLISREEEIR